MEQYKEAIKKVLEAGFEDRYCFSKDDETVDMIYDKLNKG